MVLFYHKKKALGKNFELNSQYGPKLTKNFFLWFAMRG